MNLVVIGICGPALSGKSTFGTMLGARVAERVGSSSVHHCPFAGPLKTFARAMGWNGAKDDRGRRLLQLLGTECGRECIGPDVWVDQWRALLPGRGYVIVDDVRFRNEAEAVVSGCGHLFELSRSGVAYSGHASERGLPPDVSRVQIGNSLGLAELAIAAHAWADAIVAG